MTPRLYYVHAKGPGRLAISARPRGEDWLEDEVEGWRQAGLDVIVSLLTQGETETLGLKKEPQLATAQQIQFFSFPIEDRGVPSSAARTVELAAQICGLLRQGQNVALHCRQGIGRSSMIAIAVLLLQGLTLSEAIDQVSADRGVPVPETSRQRQWLEQMLTQPEFNNFVRASVK